jgi:hypothetical protein
MILKGKFKALLKKETGTSKTGKQWEKQSFILDTGADFNSEICIATFGENIEKIQNIKEGTDIEISVNISSKEFNGKYYHNISAWKIDTQDGNTEETKDDLPF